jgi:anti-sigma B factor antagonist
VQTPGNSEGSESASIEVGPATQQLTVTVTAPGDGVAVLHAAGEIDLLTATALGERLREHQVPGNRMLVLDLTEVDFLGSSGLAEIVSAAQGSPRLVLVATSRAVLRPLEATGLLTMLTVYDTVDEAVAAARS